MFYLNLAHYLLRRCHISDTGVSAVAHGCHLLVNLTLSYVFHASPSAYVTRIRVYIGYAGASPTWACLRSLKTVPALPAFPRSCVKIANSGITAVAQHCAHLSEIDIGYVLSRAPFFCDSNYMTM